MIENSGEGVLELAESILSKDKATDEDFNCRILAEKNQQLYAPQALSKDIKLVVEHSDDPESPQYFAPKSLLQITGNLVNNAIKFTPEGGKVSVHCTIERNDDDDYLRVAVEDNGVGMSAERIDEILQGQAESKVGTEGERGYGLGLPLVRQLVDEEGGSLDLQSRPGEGCIFTVHLPI